MDEQAFAGLMDQYERLVYTICYQLTHNHHTAQDLTQETFLSVYRHLDSCPADNPKAWLARIATNKAKDHLKSAYNRRVTAADDDTLPQDKGVLFVKEEQPEDITIQREVVGRIQGEILALKEPYHKVAVMFFLEDKSVEEIAGHLERPPKTVHTQLYRAKKMLQQKWKGGLGDDIVS